RRARRRSRRDRRRYRSRAAGASAARAASAPASPALGSESIFAGLRCGGTVIAGHSQIKIDSDPSSTRTAPFQQYQYCARSARVVRGFAVGEHLVALREPEANFSLEHGLAIGRGESLAMDDAHAAPTRGARRIEEFGQRVACFITRVTVKIELTLHRPMPAPQAAQHIAGQALAQESLVIVVLLSRLPGEKRCLDAVLAGLQCRGFIGQALRGDARWRLARDRRSIARTQRRDVRECLREVDIR